MTPSTPRKLLASALLPAMLALVLGACAQKPAPPAPAPDASATPADAAPPETDAPLAGECNAEAVQALVGQEATEAVLEQAQADSGARAVRALKPGQPATMDFRPDRLDIALDEQGIIQSLRCG